MQMNDDLISRQAVCEIINDIRDCISVEGYCAILERMKKLPPVNTQEPKTDTLDKIRAEIDAHRETLKIMADDDWYAGKIRGYDCAIEIINKYRGSED